MYKVRIKSLPKAAYGQQVQGALNVNPTSFGGRDFNESMSRMNPASTRKTLTAVPREEANLEAEGGETAFGPISGQNIPDHMVIKGKRHSKGGVPLNLPDDTFIFSDTKAMRITDPNILAMFGKKSKKGGYTPAELAKPYDINKYKAILMDPDTDKLTRNTAEMMIKNFIMKLGALALAQESKKGFPQGIPAMAQPYMEANGITEEQLMPELAQQQQPAPQGQQQLPPPPSQMPSGEPVAQPMSEEEMMAMQGQGMMAYGGTPMARKGFAMANDYCPCEDGSYSKECCTTDVIQYVDREYDLYKQSMKDYGDDPSKINRSLIVERDMDLINNYMGANEIEGFSLIPDSGFYKGLRLPGHGRETQMDKGYSRAFLNKLYSDNDPRIMQKLQGLDEAVENETWEGGSAADDRYYPPKFKQQYGGTAAPMAAYGMMMGGYDVPYYSNGGYLPKAQNGDGGKSSSRQMTQEELLERIKKQKEWNKEVGTKCRPGYVLVDGKCVKGSLSDWQRPESDLGEAKGKYTGKRSTGYEQTICDQLKKGVDPQVLVDKNHAISVEALKKRFPECFEQGEKLVKTGQSEKFEGYELVQPGKKCECIDPTNGEVYTFDLEGDETKCVCPEGFESTGGGGAQGYAMQDNPMWSDVATRNVLTQATMDPNAGRVSIQRMPYQETRPAFEDYLAKTQAIQSDLAQSQDQISKFAGSTADQMAGVLQAQAAANKANLQNVADVQARNIGYLNQAEANDLRARMAGDQMNTQLALQEQLYNVGARDKETTARNQIKQNTQMAIADAEREMQNRALSNIMYPQYATEYRKGLPYFTSGKPIQPEKPAKTPAEEYNELLAAGLPDTVAGQIAAKHAKYGYVMGSNVFPFMFY